MADLTTNASYHGRASDDRMRCAHHAVRRLFRKVSASHGWHAACARCGVAAAGASPACSPRRLTNRRCAGEAFGECSLGGGADTIRRAYRCGTILSNLYDPPPDAISPQRSLPMPADSLLSSAKPSPSPPGPQLPHSPPPSSRPLPSVLSPPAALTRPFSVVIDNQHTLVA